jgi:hypothetical protein
VVVAVVLKKGSGWVAAGLLLAVAACGDDGGGGGTVELTVVNQAQEAIFLMIDGAESEIDAGDEDAITLVGDGDYTILATGLECGCRLFDETLTAEEIEDRGNRIVVTSE